MTEPSPLPTRVFVIATGLIAAVQLSFAWLAFHPAGRGLFGDEARYLRTAEAIINGQPGELELLWPPLYPHFLAGVLTPVGAESLAPVYLAQLLLLFATALVIADLGRAWTCSREVGTLAAMLLLAYPHTVSYAYFLWPEILHLFLLTAALWVATRRSERLFWAGVLGVLVGLALLTKSLLTPFIPVFGIALAWRGRIRDRISRCLVAACVLVAVITPTILHNLNEHGVATIANSSLFNHWVALNERSRRNLEDIVVSRMYRQWQRSADSFSERNSFVKQQIADHYRRNGILKPMLHLASHQYFRLLDRGTFFADMAPGGLQHRPGRTGYQAPPRWLYPALKSLNTVLYAGILVGAAAAIGLGRPRGPIWIGLTFLAYNLTLLLFVHVKTRYRLQLLPVAVILAATAVSWTWRRGDTSQRLGPIRKGLPAWTVTALLCAALLLFAFAGRWF